MIVQTFGIENLIKYENIVLMTKSTISNRLVMAAL